MSARYLCLFVVSSVLQPIGSIQQVPNQILSPDADVLEEKSYKYGYTVVLPPYCVWSIVHIDDPTGIREAKVCFKLHHSQTAAW